jgi:serine phosphatase RsbU (regulator of sigma subunit)
MSALHGFCRGYVVGLGILVAVTLAIRLAAPDSNLAALALVVTVLAALPVAVWSVRWLWRRLTYRVGVRLFISYLLIGLTPFALFACIALIVGYGLAGQYAAARVRGQVDRLRVAMTERTASAVGALEGGRVERARELLASGGSAFPEGLHAEWLLADGPRAWRSSDAAALPVPRWAPEGAWSGQLTAGGSAFLGAVERRGDRLAVLLAPLDLANARLLSAGRWYEMRFVTDVKTAMIGGTRERTVTVGGEGSNGGPTSVRINGREVATSEVEEGWLAAKPREGTLWQRARFIWMWVAPPPLELATGATRQHTLVVTLIKLSPRGAFEDLMGPREKVASDLRATTEIIGTFFATIYLVAVGFAAVMILRVTRATARLTRGARAVAGGNLEHRIPVKRRDQLGDLAVSFNTMAESVAAMLAQVAAKERMAKEVELAREIQSSLLPPTELSSGPLSVWAHFRPAAEVGGDYFDLFPLAPGSLLVAIGDVAGHGLPTGLLMAMVKSAVATLVEEGYRGGELLTRLNRFLGAQSLKQRMVSFALAEVDTGRDEVQITSAGHQPGVLLAAGEAAEEVLLSSLPLGYRWRQPPPTRVLPFSAGGRLLLYSDGLVEARTADGAAFGHERLRAALEGHRGDAGPHLLRGLLAELDRFLEGQPLADDLTIVLVEHLGQAG